MTVYRTVSSSVYELMKINAKNIKGADLLERGVLHTSLLKGYELKGSGYKLRIRVKKGTPAFYVGNLSNKEKNLFAVILVNDTKLKIISIDDYINCIVL
ncbi:ADP-ribosyltransferase [Staphylococcus saprophyticus]|uniref:ADP-ribosyltransferase n=1 Tax=Staphylococcus saprophyticus TaxID=29385 RepID=UPI002DBCE872|nr:ADP-ribosyltransferase [Staphylococcus saprophyticus]MEB8333532.1 hypothetical protein [Staphylococcus saprophyticus]